jgi:uncharacterized cupredoxin-like copper-binding protein
VVLIAGLGLAIGLVFLGAELAKTPGPAPSGEPGTSANPRGVNVIMRDYAFNPDPLHLAPGETVTFTVVNGGLVEHEFVLGDRAVQAAWAQANAAVTPPAPFATPPPASAPAGTGGLRLVVASGQTTTAIYEVPSRGELLLFCHLPGHADQGMHAVVVLDSR